MAKFKVINILDMLESIGEDGVKEVLSDFSCPLNCEIEHFVKVDSIPFSRNKSSITHFVIDESSSVVAMFCLAHKAIEISSSGVTKTIQRKMTRFSELSEEDKSYKISAFLIAQFSKNFACENCPITGDELMNLAIEVLENVQKQIGGCVVYLECENKEELLAFYQNDQNRFRIFDIRESKDGTIYQQLFRWI